MAVIYDPSVKTARMDAVLTQIGNAAKVVVGTTGWTKTLATFTLPTPSGATSGNDLVLDCDPDIETTASAGDPDTAAVAKITTSGDVDKVTGLTVSTVAAGTGDIQLVDTSITNGQTVRLVTATLSHAPDP